MRFVYEDQGSSTFVKYQVGPNEEIDSMSLGMLTNNCIPGFAPASYSQKDAEKFIKYNVTGKVPAAQIFRGPVNKKRLTGLLQGIVDAMMAAEEYMLDPNSVELDLEHIYMDPVTCETVLLCVPVFMENSAPVDLPMFLKNIVFNTQFDQTENTDHVAKIFNCLGAGSKLVLEDMKTLLDQIQGNHAPVQVAPVAHTTTTKPVGQPVVKPAVQPAVQPMVQPAVQPVAHGGQSTPVTRQPAIPDNGFGAARGQGGFEIPVQPPVRNDPPAAQEKRMSTWYLLNHMSKENMAIYKAQQAQDKGEKPSKKEKPVKDNSKKAGIGKGPQKKSGPIKREQPAFAVPGVQNMPPTTPAFDIPGQESASAKKPISAALDLPPVASDDLGVTQHSAASINFGATTVLGVEPNGTTVLGPTTPARQPIPTLVRKSTGERVEITKQTFTIGIESYVDYRITGNSAISRSHAKIIVRGSEFLLVDTNSTNGTYVNGQRLKQNVEVRIDNGCKIVFANEEFDFTVL